MGNELFDPIMLSVQVALVSALACAPTAFFVALLMVRRDFPGKLLLDALLNLPLVLPPLVTGYLLLILLGANGPVGSRLLAWFGLRIAFTPVAAALAAFVVAFPLCYRSIKTSLERMDWRLEDVARTLKARPLDLLFSITIPMNWRGIVTGTVLAFARSLGEFGATIIFAANIPGKTRTIPLAVFSFLNQPDGEKKAIPLILVATMISLAAMFLSYYLTPREKGKT